MTSSTALVEANRKRAAKVAAGRIGCPIEEYEDRVANGEAWCSGHKQWHDTAAFSGGKRRDTTCRDLKNAQRSERDRIEREKAAVVDVADVMATWTESYVNFLVVSSTARACSGAEPEWFFPEDLDGNVDQDRVDRAKTVCYQCPVADDCLTAACQRNERFGIWGGFTTNERDQIMGLVKPEWLEGL